MTRASKPCAIADCPELQPCPRPGHQRKPWQDSTRRSKTVSGQRQQKRSRFVILRDEGRCHVCGEYGANEADHVISLAEGGEDHIDNMKAIHDKPCHALKTSEEAARVRRAG